MDESANAYQADKDPVDPGSDDREEALDYDDDEENDTFSSYVALDDITVFEAAELDVIALLSDTWNDGLDPEVSAKRVHKLTLHSERTEEKVKAQQEVRARADFLFDRHICRWRTVDDD